MAEYPVKGATVKCNKSGQTATFEPIKATGANMGKGLIILETDTSPDNIVGNFGTCSGNENKTCTKSFEGEWQNCSSATYDPYSSLKNQYKTLFLEIQKWHTDKNFAFVYVGFDGNRYSATITPNNISNFTQSPPHIMFGDNAFQLGLKKMKSIVTTKETLPLGFAGDTTGMFPTKEEKEQWLAKIDELYEQSKMLPPMLMSFNNNVVLTNSYLKCKYGIVSFVVGEEGQETEEPPEDLDNLADLRERVREVIRKHYDVGSTTDDAGNVISADDNLKNTLINDYGVPEERVTNEDGTITGNAADLISGSKIEVLTRKKTTLATQLTVAMSSNNTIEKSRIATLLTYINSQLNAIGTVSEQTEILGAKSKVINTFSTEIADSTKFKVEQLLLQKERAEAAILHFDVNGTEDSLILMAWLILLNEKNIGTHTYVNSDNTDHPNHNKLEYKLTQALEHIEDEVENGNYEKFSVDKGQSSLFIIDGDSCPFYSKLVIVKQKADSLPLVLPLPKGLRNKYAENNFSGDAAKENSKYIKAGFKAVDYYLGAGIHEGVDINTGTRTGINVVAVKSGEILEVRWKRQNSFGLCPYIKNLDDSVYVYGHHENIYNSKGIGRGFYVLAGKPLGECGQTGAGSGEHLHFEVWQHSTAIHPDEYTFTKPPLDDPVIFNDTDKKHLIGITYKDVQSPKQEYIDKMKEGVK